MDNQILDHNLNSQPTSVYTLNGEAINFLGQIAKWAKFLSILGFVMMGLLVVFGLFAGTFFAKFMPAGQAGSMPSMAFAIMYSLIALLYFFPIYYLFNFSNKILRAIRNDSSADLTSAFSNLKSHYKFMGVLAIVFLSFYALMAVIGLIGFALR